MPNLDGLLNADQLIDWFWKRVPKRSLESLPESDMRERDEEVSR